MKKTLKKTLALLLALCMVFALAACGNGNDSGNSENNNSSIGNTGNDTSSADNTDESGNNAAEFKAVKIGVALYADTGAGSNSLRAYLDALSGPLNATFSYTILSQTDESANLTAIQELIASNVDGIICTMDLGTNAILDECNAAGVYLAGFLSDYNTSYTQAYDQVFKNEYFLGTVADGHCGDDQDAGYTYFDSLLEYNERNPEAAITHVAMTMFPSWAFPEQQTYVEQFVAAADEYNATAETPITVDPLDEASDVLMFAPLDSTYFAKHDGIQAIMSFAAGSFVYPTMVSAGVDSTLKLFAAGYNEGDEANFGTSGTGTYQQESCSASEAVIYPLVLLINKLNGVEFADQPANAERVSSSSMIINSDEDMAAFQSSLYLTSNVNDAFISPAEVVNMTAVANPNATYSGLVDAVQHMTVEDIN